MYMLGRKMIAIFQIKITKKSTHKPSKMDQCCLNKSFYGDLFYLYMYNKKEWIHA